MEDQEEEPRKRIVVFSFFAQQEDILDVRDRLEKTSKEETRKAKQEEVKNLLNAIRTRLKQNEKKNDTVMSKDIRQRIKSVFDVLDGKVPVGSNPPQRSVYERIASCEIPIGWIPSLSLVSGMAQLGKDIDQYYLFYQPELGDGQDEIQNKGANAIERAIKQISPKTGITLVDLGKGINKAFSIGNGHEFEKVYIGLRKYFESFIFDLEKNEYYVNVSTGSTVIRTSLTILAQERIVPADLVQLPGMPTEKRKGFLPIVSNPTTAHDKYRKIANEDKKRSEQSQTELKQGIQTRNVRFNRMIEELENVVLRDCHSPILITGPTGAGKSTIVKQIYEVRKRRNLAHSETYEAINCAVLEGNLVNSELFGHEEGAFTGANGMKKGVIERAEKGILFLDEIGSLPLPTQAKLLTVLDGAPFYRVGGSEKKDQVTPDFQLFCGTNEDLRKMVKDHLFRRDLYERISTWQFELLGLVERHEDIEPNIAFELEQFKKEIGRNGNGAKQFHGKPLEEFLAYAKTIPFEGNFRELHRMIWRMATLAKGDEISIADVEAEIARHAKETANPGDDKKTKNATDNPEGKDPLQGLVEDVKIEELEKEDPLALLLLREVVRICHKSKNAATAGREISSKGHPPTNPSDVISRFFRQKCYVERGINLSFGKIHGRIS